MSLITRNAKKSIETRLHNKCHKIYLRSPLGIFCLYVILINHFVLAARILWNTDCIFQL